VRWLLGLLAVGLVMLVALLWFGQRRLVYFPDPTDPGPASAQAATGSDVELTTSDGLTLRAWRIDPAAPRGAAVVYLPGNAGNRSGRIDVAQALADEGFVVLLVDYRGYGGNPGRPSEAGLVRDAQAAAAHLRGAGFPAQRTVYVGESLGTGVAVQLAVSDPPAGLLLRSPFTSLPAVASATFGGLPIGWAVRDRFDTLASMPAVRAPVTVLAAGADTVIPPEQSTEVAQAAADLHELTVVPGAGHNDAVWFGPFLAARVDALADAAIER
jgi:hypothetical protein